MPQALRPYVTAGIAIAGAGVIAITPSTPPPQAAVDKIGADVKKALTKPDKQASDGTDAGSGDDE